MQWTLEKIRAEVRKLTGRRSANSLSDADLDEKVNHFLTLILPYELDLHEFDGFESFVTVAGTETYTLASDVLRIEPGVKAVEADGTEHDVDLYLDPVTFKADYPDATNDEAAEREVTTGLLLLNQTIYLRPVPDAVYTIRYSAKLHAPAELTLTTSTPTDNAWGWFICHGAAIQIHKGAGEHDEAEALSAMYETLKSAIARKQLLRYPDTHRAAPRF